MEGRFSRMFELLNQRNTEYYQQAFSRLDKENKTTFNFAAAIFSVIWLVFRKMYGWAILLILASGGVQYVLYALCQNSKVKIISLLVIWLVMIVGFGFWGNSLYYKTIKSGISKGYAEITGYNAIDPIGSMVIIGVVIPLLIGITSGILVAAKVTSSGVAVWLSPLMNVFFIAIFWAINYRKFHAQEPVESVEVTEEAVNKYLEKANPKRLTVSVGITTVTYLISFLLILSVMFVLAVVGVKATGEKILRQLNEISENIDKTPSKNSQKNLIGRKALKQPAKFSDYLNAEKHPRRTD